MVGLHEHLYLPMMPHLHWAEIRQREEDNKGGEFSRLLHPSSFYHASLRTVDIRFPFPAMNVKMLKVNNTLIVSEDALGSNLVA